MLIIRSGGCGCLGFGCIHTDVVLLIVVKSESLILASATVDALELVVFDGLEVSVTCRWHAQSDCRGIQFACSWKVLDRAKVMCP